MAKGPALTGHIIKLEITLKRTDPPIWRGLLVPAHMTLGDLHYVIQRAMGWDNEHLHEFRVGKTTYGESGPGVRALDPDGVTLGDVQRKGIRNFIYIYDFGDSWEHVCAMKGHCSARRGSALSRLHCRRSGLSTRGLRRYLAVCRFAHRLRRPGGSRPRVCGRVAGRQIRSRGVFCRSRERAVRGAGPPPRPGRALTPPAPATSPRPNADPAGRRRRALSVDPPPAAGQGCRRDDPVAPMLLLIDNYDSFTFNLYHFLGEVGGRCEVVRNDKLTVAEAMARQPEAIVLSPGPCTPNEAGICLDLIAAAAGRIPDPRRLPRPPGDRPGVRRQCGPRSGADARQDQPHLPRRRRHPGRRPVALHRHPLPQPDRRSRHPAGRIAHHRLDRGRHRHGPAPPHLPIYGVQFHPESIASEHGHALLANFLAIARGTNQPARAA